MKMDMGISEWINCGRVKERMNKYVIRREFGTYIVKVEHLAVMHESYA